jgi:ATP-dependent exoDNAse (exonuclease V) alpha subunit
MSYRLCGPQLLREKTFASLDELKQAGVEVFSMGGAESLYDFGYCFTTHKSQGSQFKHAIVFMDRGENPNDVDFRRWIYTSITRGAEKLTLLGG